MRKIIKIDEKNLESFYYNMNGNLYYCYPESSNFQVLLDFELDECFEALENGVDFIWIEGPEI